MLRRALKGWAWLTALVVLAAPAVAVNPASAAATFNVRDYGAAGNGSTNDTAAINKAITAANSAGGGIVQFPSGTYKSSNTIHLKSNVTIQLDSGSTIMGSSAKTYDAPESNPYDAYQDYGHSHFHNAMIYGDRLTNIGFTGSGTIDGGGNLITGNPSSGEADKILSLTRCDGLTLNGVKFRRGGHFAILTNNCNNITSDHLRIDTASDRDGWNVISAQNVTVTNADIAANDDALVFKSDYALGAKLPNGHVTVTDSHLSAQCCNALMFGSETCGDFTDYQFSRINITGAQKSGLGLVSMDGAVITDVHYHDITMTGVRSPIMQKVGTRKRCGNSPGVGRISNITYENVTGTGASPSFSPTLWGESGSNRISDVTFTNVHLTVPGGNGTMSTGVPSNDPNNYNPNSIGTRPAYGFYIHNANNITFNDSSVEFASNDGRPAIIANTGSSIKFNHFTAERGTSSPHDMGFQSVTGYCVADSANTAGGALRISNTSSTESCPTSADFSLGVTPSSQTVTAGSSATYTVNTSTVSGSPGPITLSASGLPAGATATFSPNPVTPGSSSTLTVATAASTPDGSSTLTVTGTASSQTHTATAGLTVGTSGGGGTTVTAEAESGTVTAPMQVASDAAAWGGQYVTVAPGNNSTGSAPSNGSTVIPFSVSAAGTYRFWGRVIAPANTDDSFWVRVDGGSWVNWNDITTGAAWHWAPVTNDASSDAPITASLSAGSHTLTVAYREDGAKLDRVLITDDAGLVPANDPPPAGTRYEAENATISQGVVESNWAGFSGTGFVNLDNVAGSYVEWTANADAAGTATLKFRFANGTTADRPMTITVNGTTAGTLTFSPTGAWTTWQTATVTVPLNAGANVIRATGSTATSGPNLDYLEI
ncbi:glycosyl hydrolase family 28 protein [Planotetraspora sp. GP83]|uniref:glycosyl hydrolase family 28 protein n=1 Tax=Planotetraspora sp. GP83 TaxID=3156264 RepID=UPI0035157DF7